MTSPIKEMSILADAIKEKEKKDIVSFGQGIPYFDTPPHIKDGIRKALENRFVSRYTLYSGITELRNLIARYLESSRGIEKIEGKKEIMVTIGCQEAVACAISTVLDEKDEILLPSPTYASHIEQPLHFGAKPVFVPLIEKSGWKWDFEALEKKITKRTKAILFSNPSNPTGVILDREQGEVIAKIARKHDLIIISDETYDFLTYDGRSHFSVASVPGIRDRLILCGSFSKKYALTGYRVGYAFSDKGIIDHMLKVHDALAICAPAISQAAAMSALSGPQDSVAEFVRKLDSNRKLMCQKLDEMPDFFEYQKPMGAYYILAKYKFPKMDSFEVALKILNEADVIVVPGAAFGPTGEGHVRFSFACSPEEIEEGFRRLKNWALKSNIK